MQTDPNPYDPQADDENATIYRNLQARFGVPAITPLQDPAAPTAPTTSPSFLPGDSVDRSRLPAAGPSVAAAPETPNAPTSGSPVDANNWPISEINNSLSQETQGGTLHTSPSGNQTIVYTDPAGNGYDAQSLLAAWTMDSGMRSDPLNARVPDILAQYGFNVGGGSTSVGSTSGGGGGNGTAAATINTGPTEWQQQIRKIIMERLGAAQQPVDVNAPEITSAVNAAKDEYSRQNDVERNALAERLYAQQARGGGGGLNTDAVTQGIQQSNERTGTALSSLRARLIMQEYSDKHAELSHLLDLATQSGDNEQARNIQMAMANLQAAVQREGLGINLAEFGAQLDQNAVLAGLRG